MFPNQKIYVRRPPKLVWKENTNRKLQNLERKGSWFGASLPMMAGKVSRKLQETSIPIITLKFCKKIFSNMNLGEIFQQDNAVDLLENWPAQSPDLNIIENVWCTLKQRVLKRHPKNIEDLWSACQDEFERIPLFYIPILHHSIPARLNEVVWKCGEKI